jgi:hypothetical protein
MKLILPCGGESSRFPGVRPKWLLTQPNGRLMVCDAIANLNLDAVDQVVLIAKDEHISGNEESLRRAFKDSGCHKEIEFFSLTEKTKSQPETVANYLNSCDSDFSFFIKFCDGQFECNIEPKNEVITANIGLITGNSASSKSYCRMNENGEITAIVEKQVISQDFCVGGYSFMSRMEFLESYDEIKHLDNLYVSHVIENLMISKKVKFTGKRCKTYEDWGTLQDWIKYKSTFRTLFVDIDGVLVKNSSEYFDPKWGSTGSIKNNVEHLMSLKKAGRTQIILTTARSEKFSNETERQLKEAGLSYDGIIYGLLHAKRVIVNDFSRSNPYPSCESVNIPRDSSELSDILRAQE